MTPELSRPITLDRIGAHGTAMQVDATPAELAALTERYRIPAVLRLRCRLMLRRVGGSVIEGKGVLDAVVRQVCVVSLEEFEQPVREPFTVHFVPEGSEDDDPDPNAIDQIPYAGSTADAGEAVAEQLALALDPYPRSPGAVPPLDEALPPDHPFAGLAALRPKQ